MTTNEIIAAIKGLNVMELAQLVKALETEFGVSAAVPMAAAAPAAGGAAAPAAPVEEKTEFDVVIKDAGPKKIEVIKVIRQLVSLSLTEAKTLAETADGKVLAAVGKDAAMDAKKKLEEAGAVIEVK